MIKTADDIENWVDSMFENEESSKHFDEELQFIEYDSTYEVYPEKLQYAHNAAPNKYLIQTEARMMMQEVPVWKDDQVVL